MKKTSVIFLLILATQVANAQTTFQKTYGSTSYEYASHMCRTSDSGFVILGIKQGNIYLLRLDANCNMLWDKSLWSSNSPYGQCIQQTSDGGYIIGGSTTSSGAGLSDALYLKTDSAGNVQWSKVLSNPTYNEFTTVLQTPDGGYICSGAFNNGNGGWSGVYLVKINSIGDTLWTKAIRSSFTAAANSLKLTNDNGFIITGPTYNSGDCIYVLKTDSMGNPLWAKTYGGSTNDYGSEIQNTTDGGYVIVGSTTFGAGNSNIYLIKTDSLGALIWSKSFGGPNYEFGSSILQTNDGGYILTGFTTPLIGTYDIYIIKTDLAGDTLWTQTIIGGNKTDAGGNIFNTSDGGYVILSDSDINGPSYDILIVKIDSLGNNNCNTGNTPIIVYSPLTQVTIPLVLISNGGTILQPSFTTSIPGAITTLLCQSTSIEESSLILSELNIYPNPTNGSIVISSDRLITYGTIEIYSLLGEIISNVHISNASRIDFMLENIPSGIYVIKLMEDKNIYYKKITVEH